MKHFLILLSFSILLLAQNKHSSPLVHTYSIVARDPITGYLGVAVQSNWFAVGSLVTWAEAGVGAIATQSFINVSFGPEGLSLLKKGFLAQAVLDTLIKHDSGRDFRQLAIVDNFGNVAAYTGAKCIESAGNISGSAFSCQANLMLNDKIWPAMKEAFESSKGNFAERLLDALDAAQKAGGDIRGKQSAAILIVKDKKSEKAWEDIALQLHVEDHENPLKELRRLYNLQIAYDHMNKGDYFTEINDMPMAMKEYNSALKDYPKNIEFKFWTAVTMANNNMIKESLVLFKECFKSNKNWKTLIDRIVKNEMLKTNDENLKKIKDLN